MIRWEQYQWGDQYQNFRTTLISMIRWEQYQWGDQYQNFRTTLISMLWWEQYQWVIFLRSFRVCCCFRPPSSRYHPPPHRSLVTTWKLVEAGPVLCRHDGTRTGGCLWYHGRHPSPRPPLPPTAAGRGRDRVRPQHSLRRLLPHDDCCPSSGGKEGHPHHPASSGNTNNNKTKPNLVHTIKCWCCCY